MSRIVLPNGQWFDPDTAVQWSAEAGRHSDGDPVAMETLWRSKLGTFVVQRVEYSYSDAEDTVSFSFKTDGEAVAWLLRNGCEDIPDDLLDHVGELEI